MCRRASIVVLLAGFCVAGAVLRLQGSGQAVRQNAQQIFNDALELYDPPLIRAAEAKGLYKREDLPILREMNPYYIRGDFNGDGGQDVAFWVSQKATSLRGVVILHSTLDALHVFGAGRPIPAPQRPGDDPMSVDTWHLLSRGDVVGHPFTDVPEIGVKYGTPFTFQRETLEFVYLGKSAFVIYWANGRYWHFWTAD